MSTRYRGCRFAVVTGMILSRFSLWASTKVGNYSGIWSGLDEPSFLVSSTAHFLSLALWNHLKFIVVFYFVLHVSCCCNTHSMGKPRVLTFCIALTSLKSTEVLLENNSVQQMQSPCIWIVVTMYVQTQVTLVGMF